MIRKFLSCTLLDLKGFNSLYLLELLGEITEYNPYDLKILGCRKLFMPKFIPKFYCYQICMLRGYALKSKELHCVQHGVQTWTT